MNHTEYNRAMNWQPSPIRMQNRWSFYDFTGKLWPIFFPTKEAAKEAGQQHIAAVIERIRYGSGAVHASNDGAAK